MSLRYDDLMKQRESQTKSLEKENPEQLESLTENFVVEKDSEEIQEINYWLLGPQQFNYQN